jgi:hypothetical protein
MIETWHFLKQLTVINVWFEFLQILALKFLLIASPQMSIKVKSEWVTLQPQCKFFLLFFFSSGLIQRFLILNLVPILKLFSKLSHFKLVRFFNLGTYASLWILNISCMFLRLHKLLLTVSSTPLNLVWWKEWFVDIFLVICIAFSIAIIYFNLLNFFKFAFVFISFISLAHNKLSIIEKISWKFSKLMSKIGKSFIEKLLPSTH